MSPKRAVTREGLPGWRFRYTCPLTNARKKIVHPFADKLEAIAAHVKFVQGLHKVRVGLPDETGWQMTYDDLVARFLKEAPVSTEKQRKRIKSVLTENALGIQIGRELANRGKLHAKLVRYAQTLEQDPQPERRRADGKRAGGKQRTAHYAAHYVQKYLKQLSRWAADNQLFPYDPLAGWRRMRVEQKFVRRSFEPDELQQILQAANDLDTLCAHSHDSAIVFGTLFLSGNRPTAVLCAKVRDFVKSRAQIHLPAGNGKKRNGAAMLPRRFAEEVLERYVSGRAHAAPLLLSHEGLPIDRHNLRKWFRRCCVLAFVRMAWPRPEDAGLYWQPSPAVMQLQMDVATRIYFGKPRGFDGRKPTTPAKQQAREQLLECVEKITEQLRPEVERRLEHTDMYALRKTFVSWARRLSGRLGYSIDSVNVQVGHAPKSVEERHYLDLVDPAAAAEAVWRVLAGEVDLNGQELTDPRDYPLFAMAAGAEGLSENGDYIGHKREKPARLSPDKIVAAMGVSEKSGPLLAPAPVEQSLFDGVRSCKSKSSKKRTRGDSNLRPQPSQTASGTPPNRGRLLPIPYKSCPPSKAQNSAQNEKKRSFAGPARGPQWDWPERPLTQDDIYSLIEMYENASDQERDAILSETLRRREGCA